MDQRNDRCRQPVRQPAGATEHTLFASHCQREVCAAMRRIIAARNTRHLDVSIAPSSRAAVSSFLRCSARVTLKSTACTGPVTWLKGEARYSPGFGEGIAVRVFFPDSRNFDPSSGRISAAVSGIRVFIRLSSEGCRQWGAPVRFDGGHLSERAARTTSRIALVTNSG